jgi:hypothetical protein
VAWEDEAKADPTHWHGGDEGAEKVLMMACHFLSHLVIMYVVVKDFPGASNILTRDSWV